jgi:hypothetical protein
MTGQVAPQSMVNQYFANQPTSSLSSSLETSYNNAKSNINNILGILLLQVNNSATHKHPMAHTVVQIWQTTLTKII